MGIPGMILAPVVLHYVRAEALRIEVAAVRPVAAPASAPAAAREPAEVVLAEAGAVIGEAPTLTRAAG